MWAIRKDKLIAIFCILVFGFTGVAMAQEKITDASLRIGDNPINSCQGKK